MNRKLRRASEREGAREMRKSPTGFVDILRHDYKFPKGCSRIFKSNKYFVFIYPEMTCGMNGKDATVAMVRRLDAKPFVGHWSEMQKIKNTLFGDVWAAEFYPPKNELSDEANIYWLWFFDEVKILCDGEK